MRNRRILTLIVALAALMAWSTVAEAQKFQPFGPQEFSDEFQPFAPAEVSSFGGGPDPHTGLFFTYDRMNWYVTRPTSADQPIESDLTWGNRLDAGFMTKQNQGWLFELIHIDGPNVVTVDNAIENSFDMVSVELMKMWRLKPFHHGSILELFAGARYARFQHADVFLRDLVPTRVIVTDPEQVGVGGVTRFNGIHVENNVYGPQAGMRWFKQKNRWTLSAEGRYFFGYNNQFLASRQPIVGGTALLNTDEQIWVHAGDVRLEAAFTFSKSFSLAVGWELLYFGNGIGRGPGAEIDQDVAMSGVTFGFKCNR